LVAGHFSSQTSDCPSIMNTLYHITSGAAWSAAQAAGEYRGDTLASEGFIHCSLAAQVERTAARFYRGQQGLVLLVIDPTLLASELRYEEGEPGELFPHIYGPLNLAAVTAALPFPPEADGTFRLRPGADR
jgi:uncharacterized protein (DUF952 family)